MTGRSVLSLTAVLAVASGCGSDGPTATQPADRTSKPAPAPAAERPGVSPEKCVKRFNSERGDGARNFVEKSGKDPSYGPVTPGYVPLVWIGASGVKPSRCLLWVTLGDDRGPFVAIRESLFENSRAGFQPIPGSDEDGGLIRSPNAYGTSDGKVRLGSRP